MNDSIYIYLINSQIFSCMNICLNMRSLLNLSVVKNSAYTFVSMYMMLRTVNGQAAGLQGKQN